MRNFIVHVPEKSHRRSILKRKEILTYFPLRKDFEADPVIPESEPIRSESPELHWICWPEPKRNKTPKRPYTSQGLYTDRNSGNQTPRNDRSLNEGKPVQYDPKIKSWTNVSAENDRKAVDAMFSTMKRSHSFYEPMYKPMTSISVNDPPPKDKYTRYGGQVVDPRSLYQQNFSPYYQPHGTGPRDAMHLQDLSRQMNQSQSPAFNHNYSFNKYPLHMRRNKRSAATTDDYVHERSMFMTTTPNCVGHFIIHPDWVSERSSLRRSKSMLQMNSSSKF
ncbi:uncharacterized protein LOC123566164 isoform X2 [Mercenaria mercenaria]|uniref:uncharacterized protein LOC123566164 isoform X2 n=1 Tax=Mercenaria mercenaria TaxID=6596 RepID=UPI00234ED296|nr:uncharacterized protein LOC123566164 isoform X2 [Mercenaria mercenaria]